MSRKLAVPAQSVTAVFLSLSMASGHADSFHYKNLIPGDRAAGLGGAFVALADDTSGTYYNPAGIVYSKETASGTVNVVADSRTRFSGVFPDGDGLREKSTALIPGFVGLVKQFDDRQAVGFTLVVSDYLSEQRSGDFAFGFDRPRPGTPMPDAGLKQAYISEDIASAVYQAGPSYALKFDSGWSLGASLLFRYSSFRNVTVVDSTAVYPGAADTYYFQYGDSSFRQTDRGFSVQPVLGAIYRNGPESFGISLRRPFGFKRSFKYDYNGLVVLDFYSTDDTTPLATTATLPTRQRTRTRSSAQEPFQLSAGTAYSFGSTVVTGQVDYFNRVSQATRFGREQDPDRNPLSPVLSQPSQLPRKAVLNVALAAETAIDPRWTLRAAFFTDRSNIDGDAIGVVERREVVHLTGIAASATYFREKQHVTFGLYASQGHGTGTLGDLGQIASTNGNSDGRFGLFKRNINIFISYDFTSLLN